MDILWSFCLLGDAGVIPEEDVDHWVEKDYELDFFLKSRHFAEMEESVEGEVASITGEEESETPKDQALRGRHEYHEQQIKTCQMEFERTDGTHSQHREIYHMLLREFRQMNPQFSGLEAEQRFGPVYVQRWKCCIQALRNAEEAFNTAKAEVDDELTKSKFELEKKEAKERSLEEKIQWTTKTSIDGCDRARIKKWLSEVATDSEVAVLSIEDSVKLWKEPEYQSTTKQNRMKVSTGAGISRNTLDGNMSVDDGDEEWVFVTREETATIPIFGSECSDRTPHLKMVFLDSASIFDGDFNYRGDIDKCARNLRNGYN
ncbi:hypothetical protein HBI56_057410 [Parastagonospora nodorum]|nr:hypothetical protein HBH53_150390 [Parastagonospora nodorum]KAH3967013.1 hypothetical protein HBH51_141810 [Parastagonospora nodorum]KAH4003224.1 hypothetical protein HBI10_070390 [Parastagonospora nodorum]KAH4027912.1 hypothetical protein HBI13_047630 [Parastagonospora nodorum]KAH4091835.1 hypothetical protein HBH46_183340 [Parastagonospora nodorum]